MTPLHAPTFFAYARRAPFGGRLTQSQVAGCERLMAACRADDVTDDRRVAYLLASVFHETGGRMQPVRETFASSDAQAVRRLDAAMAAGQLRQVSKPYWRGGWFGRGDVQVTHERNYRKIFAALGLPADTNPAALLEPGNSARATVLGMRDGLFVAGQTLDRYFSAKADDPVGARRIVNGTDKASLIAGYYVAFLDSIEAARAEAATPFPAPAAVAVAAKPDGADLKTDKTAIGGMLAGLGGLGGLAAFAQPILQSVNSPWAMVFAVVIALGVFIVLTGRVQLKRVGGV